MKTFYLIVLFVMPMMIYADNIKFSAMVIDDLTQEPMKDVCIGAGFTTDNGPVWEGRFKFEHKKFFSDKKGMCEISGNSNCGKAGCYIENPPAGYYKTWSGVPMRYKKKNIFGVWQPDNLVVTLRLQRVENPIPLFVKKATLKNHKDGIGGFDGTNSVVRFDLMKGDWLPPYGKGEVADVEFKSTLEIKGKAWFAFEPRKYDWVYFYNLGTEFSCLSKDDGFSVLRPEPWAGIKIRNAEAGPKMRRLGLINIGRNQKFHKNGEDWDCQNYKDDYSERNISFRIRSKYDEKGDLKEAYYGKIYGDFEIEGDDKKGLTRISFLYYLNPNPLDRNLEWDMKNNLCPNPGSLSQPMP
jgi:hypothetical protein